DLSGNRISTIPDMTSLTNLTSLNLSGNNLQFDDLEPNVEITGINYASQRVIGTIQRDTIRVGSDKQLEVVVGATANNYKWTRTNDLGSAVAAEGVSSTYLIESIDYETMGAFTVEATSNLVPGLTLRTARIQVLASADLAFTALDLDDNSFTAGEGIALRVTAE